MKEYPEIYAVDFDGTLNFGKYPELGDPNLELINMLRMVQKEGDKLILWTCREGELLQAAVDYCKEYGLAFDYVNENTKENIEKFGSDCRKVFAHYYIDDRNMPILLNTECDIELPEEEQENEDDQAESE